ncbi:ADP-ribosylation factor-binding protein GGA1-like [Asterias rubens]|uniref:ADP-ribosylation factor-binding protein GGA1-like n=1 Tax=Asterias rubens TaxID=7604 RepID=UPI00145527AF|nr:ADP-ribosylation factor-binding protein GGA1-like [Asterias rubens]
MASVDESETLETLLNKATNPMNRDEDWEYIMNFCDRVNKELEGPEIACRLLGHKIQSPQEREAMQGLTVIEACVKNCGEAFHRQVGKFRFLNELIKLISPKYLGAKSPASVQKKVIEIMYSWQAGLPEEPKIIEAYQMLKKQGLVKEDPVYMDKEYFPPPPPRPKNASFEDEEKSKLLARLLKSKHPDDLQAANRLIKNMVKEDEKKTEKVSRRMNELESCNNNVKLLTEMMEHYQPGVTSEQEMELMKELYISCEKMRPNLFRLASDSEDKDDGIADVLQTNDSLVKVMDVYKDKIGLASLDQPSSPPPTSPWQGSFTPPSAPSARTNQPEDSLLDLTGLDPSPAPTNDGLPPFPAYVQPSAPQTTHQSSTQLLQDQLSSLGISTASSQVPSTTQSFVRTSVTQKTSPTSLESMLGPAPTSTLPNYNFMNQQPGSVFNSQQQVNNLQARINPTPMAMPTAGGAAGMMVRPAQAAPMGMNPAQTTPMGMNPAQATPMGMNPAQATSMGMNPAQATPMGMNPRTNTAPVRLPQKSRPPSGGGAATSQGGVHSPFADLESLGKSMMKQQVNGTKQQGVSSQEQMSTFQSTQQVLAAPTQGMTQPQPQGASQSVVQSMAPAAVSPAAVSPAIATVLSLADMFVPLDTIQPGTVPPVTAYEKNLIKTVFHFAKNVPRPDITVLVVSTMSTNPSPVKNVVFQAAVPKMMRVKLQPPSATDLPAFNPILPPSAITQVMLIANPQKEKVRLKFKIQYTVNDQPTMDVGEVDKFIV